MFFLVSYRRRALSLEAIGHVFFFFPGLQALRGSSGWVLDFSFLRHDGFSFGAFFFWQSQQQPSVGSDIQPKRGLFSNVMFSYEVNGPLTGLLRRGKFPSSCFNDQGNVTVLGSGNRDWISLKFSDWVDEFMNQGTTC